MLSSTAFPGKLHHKRSKLVFLPVLPQFGSLQEFIVGLSVTQVARDLKHGGQEQQLNIPADYRVDKYSSRKQTSRSVQDDLRGTKKVFGQLLCT